MIKYIVILSIVILLYVIFRKREGIPKNIKPAPLANKPPMGWNSWNCFNQEIDEDKIKEIVDCFVDLRLDSVGYEYIIIDDGWASNERDADGNLQAHETRFPSGMKAIGDYIHSKGLKFGLYTSVGRETCEGFPGSYDHEKKDMTKFAEWGVDYVKIDWCTYKKIWWPFWNYKTIYYKMSKAIHETGRPMVINLCNWGFDEPWLWGPKIAHSWRVTYDIKPTKDSIDYIVREGKKLYKYNGPNHWNDLDMLEVGNEGISGDLAKYHFEMWCKLKSPLILGCDLRSISKEDLEIITNENLIELNQRNELSMNDMMISP